MKIACPFFTPNKRNRKEKKGSKEKKRKK